MSDRPTVLNAEDDEDIAELLRMTLEWAGYRVVTVPNGQAALDALEVEHPDLFLLDLNMPKLSGVEVARRLRDDPRFGETPIVMLTATESEAREADAANAGVTRYVLKPLSPSALVQVANEVLGRGK